MRSDRGTDPAADDDAVGCGGADTADGPVVRVPEGACGELELLLDLSARLAGGLELGPILDHTLAVAAAIGGTTMAAFGLSDDDDAGLELGAHLGLDDPLLALLGGAAQLCRR
ncbi:hypothetical protein POL58_08920, partial [Nannocystis sp. ncelm1]